MNYIKLLNDFSKHCKMNFLPANSRLLWHDLVGLFNDLGWPEWIHISNARLMDELQISNEKRFIDVRNKLIEQKLFIYEKGKKGCPNKYKINCEIYRQNIEDSVSTNDSINDSTNDSQNAVQTPDINKLNKTKLNKTPKSTNVLSSPKLGKSELDPMFIEFWDAYPRKENKPSAVRAFGKIKPMSRVVLDEILAGINRYKNSDQWAEIKFIPHPATFLNGKRWLDEIQNGGQNYAKINDTSRLNRKICTEYSENDDPPPGLYDN